MKIDGCIFIDNYVGNVSDDVEIFQVMNRVDFDLSVVVGYKNDDFVSLTVTDSEPSVSQLRISNRSIKPPVW